MSYTAGTFIAKPKYIKNEWVEIDASDQTLGRLATRIAKVLRGKHKCYYTPNINCGDMVVVYNAAKIIVTGNKLENNKFIWHTGYPGGIKQKIWKNATFSFLLSKAVKRMMPKESPLARRQLASLKIYEGDTHPHGAQNPRKIDIAFL